METITLQKKSQIYLLLIEDEQSHADIIIRTLHNKKENFLVTTSDSVKKAIDLIGQNSFDVILTDWRLPDGTGIDVVKSASEVGTPTILMTSYGNEETAVEALKMGASDYIVKSGHNISDMYRTIIRVLDEHNNSIQREQVERELLISENKYRTLIENLQGIAYRCKYDNFFTMEFLSSGFEVITGYKCEDFTNSSKYSFADIILEEDLKKVKEAIAKAVDSKNHFVIEYRIKCADSSVKWVHEKGKPYMIDGQLFVDGVILDITDKKTSDSKILKWQQKFELVSAISGQVIYIYNKKTQKAIWSENIETVLGYKKDELETIEKWTQNIHPDHQHHTFNKFKSAFNSKTNASFEYLFKHKSGKYLHIKEQVAAIEDGSDEVTGVMQDISAIKDQEKKLRESEIQLNQVQKMEALGHLIGGFAHDFNNIINGILGFAQLLQMKLTDQPKLKDYAGKIMQASIRATEMSQKLLSFTRKKVSEKESVNIHKSIEDTIDLIENTFNKNIIITKNLLAKKHYITAQYSQIQNVFINLAVNARDAMENGGKLKFETQSKEITDEFSQSTKEYIEISVSDTGVGIPENVIDKIFDPFFTTKSEGKGSGLGLSLVAGTIKDLLGNITVNSNSSGTDFTVLLPVYDNNDNQTKSNLSDYAKLDKGKGIGNILIIDDEKNIRDFIAEYLEDLGYTVYKASNGEEGFEIFESIKQTLALVILDIVMPGINGKQFYEKIEPITPELPVIFISGHTTNIDIKPHLSKAKNAFLQKPFTPDELSKKISSIIRK